MTTAKTTTKRITLATIKSFIRRNRERLYIKCRGEFDGMVDGVEWNKSPQFVPARPIDNEKYTLGIGGAWFVGGSRDRFTLYDDGEFAGYECARVWRQQ